MSRKQKHWPKYNNDDLLYIKERNSANSLNSGLYSSNGADSKKGMYSKEADPQVYQESMFDNDSSYVNLNYWYRGDLMQLVVDPFKELALASEIVVERKVELLEMVEGCESTSRYNVYLFDKEKKKKFLFKCKDDSTCCCRKCIPASNRSFKLRMFHVKDSNKRVNYYKSIASFERQHGCSCCCLCRPGMTAYYKDELEEMKNMKTKKKKQYQGDNTNNKRSNSSGRKVIGKIKEMNGCKPMWYIYNDKEELRWKLIGNYCQCGFYCRKCAFGRCYEVDLWIYDGNAQPKTAKPVGNVHKVFKGLNELDTDNDAYILTFPQKATPIERMMLVGMVMMVNVRYFEEDACCNCGNVM